MHMSPIHCKSTFSRLLWGWTGFISVPTMPAFPRRAASEAENLEAEECKLDPASLAGMLEADVRVRNRLRYREEGKLLRWMKNEKGNDVVGQLAMPIIAMNVRALTILARYWCPKTKKVAKSPSIHLVRKEARFGTSPVSSICWFRYQNCFQLGWVIIDHSYSYWCEYKFCPWSSKMKSESIIPPVSHLWSNPSFTFARRSLTWKLRAASGLIPPF